MKLLNTRLHGLLDYILGILLIVSPWLFGFGSDHISTWVPVLAGAAVILYSLFTNYERGFIPEIPTRAHLVMDGIVGIFLVASPWLFNFDEIVYLPHLVMGLLLMAISVSTETVPSVVRKRKPI